MKNLFLVLSAIILMATVVTAQTTWQLDKAHTNIGFSVTHMVIADVVGDFKEFEGTVTSSGEGFENTKVEFVLKTASVSTDHEKRDKHLRSSDFFNAEINPEIKFASKSFSKVEANRYKILGDLTLHGITKEVTFDAVLKGQIVDGRGNTRAGFKAVASIDRYEFDMKYNSVMEAGGMLIGQTVDILVDIELIKK